MSKNGTSPVIQLNSVHKRFGRVAAVDDVSLTVNRGEFMTIFGPNGAGKTTLLRLMCGLTRISDGTVLIHGLDILDHHDELRSKIGLISHQTFTYGHLTPMENLTFFGQLYGVENATERAKALLADVGLSSRADDPTRGFSRGMLQRLSIARALIHEPDILFLDEPFTGLDQHAAKTLTQSLAKLHDENRTIVMITHNLHLGLEMGTRVALQVAGKIHMDQPSENFDNATFDELYFKTVGEAHY